MLQVVSAGHTAEGSIVKGFSPSAFLILGALLLGPIAVRAETLPAHLVPAEVEHLDAAKEPVSGLFPGLLVEPKGEQLDLDEKYRQPFHATCAVYMAERTLGSGAPTGYALRFVVHAPDAEALPLAKRVAHLLLLLLGENRTRLNFDHPISDPIVNVWLTRQGGQGTSADAGGEQIRSNIYLYSIYTERRPIEWAREVAHEYGHYALPGVSGYTAPEEWANGVLGERLFLKWLREDLHAGRLHPEELPFVTPEEIDDYLTRQVIPLVRRIAHEGLDESQMKRRDAPGMDYYTGFALFLDTVYGSQALLSALSYTMPAQGDTFIHAMDFLRGMRASLADAPVLTLALPALPPGKPLDVLFVYLPRGDFTITTEGPVRSWEFTSEQKGLHPIGKDGLLVGLAAWRKLRVVLGQTTEAPVRIVLHRRGTEVQ
jgi:hypothetical protein